MNFKEVSSTVNFDSRKAFVRLCMRAFFFIFTLNYSTNENKNSITAYYHGN